MKVPVIVSEYNPQWPLEFQRLAAILLPAVQDLVVGIEHVGSTAVPGLVAKPIIDVDLVVRDAGLMPAVIGQLEQLGYVHLGNLGISDREAFRQPPQLVAHHLYACLESGQGLRNHLALREVLRADAQAVAEYSSLKRALAAASMDVDSYCRAKTPLIIALLRRAGIGEQELERIRRENEDDAA